MSNRYETTDLALAAFLTARGHKLVGVGGTPSRSVFAFETPKEAWAAWDGVE